MDEFGSELGSEVDAVAAETNYSGVVRVDREGSVVLARAYGMAYRALDIPISLDTQFGIASGTKTFTALTVLSLIDSGTLALSTTARSLLGADLPLIGDDVTVEHLLAHRSGIGDFLDENDDHYDSTAYVLDVPVHQLTTIESYLPILGGRAEKFEPGTDFAYCNGGYVVLALLAERASGIPFHELVITRVCKPARLDDTAFLRSDELPGRAALGYLDVDTPRTNVLHLPVIGSGDGGIYTTVNDVHALWPAILEGRIVSPDLVAEMTRPRSTTPSGKYRYGLGMWLPGDGDTLEMEGADAGVAFRSTHHPSPAITYTAISNTTDGAWPMAERLASRLAP